MPQRETQTMLSIPHMALGNCLLNVARPGRLDAQTPQMQPVRGERPRSGRQDLPFLSQSIPTPGLVERPTLDQPILPSKLVFKLHQPSDPRPAHPGVALRQLGRPGIPATGLPGRGVDAFLIVKVHHQRRRPASAPRARPSTRSSARLWRTGFRTLHAFRHFAGLAGGTHVQF